MKKLKTDWLYYIDKYKYVLDKSKNQDLDYLKMTPDKINFLENLKKCSFEELISIMISIYLDKYPTESRVIFGRLEKENYRELNDIELVVFDIDDLFNLISYTIIFREEQQGVIQLIENILSNKEVSVDTQEDQTVFKVVNSPIKELIVSNKKVTLNINENAIDEVLAKQG